MPEDIVLEILKRIQSDMAAVKSDMSNVKQHIAELTIGQNVLVQEGRMIRAALNDLGKTRVSAGEVEAMHTDINELVHRVTKIEAALWPPS
jgi:polyhydroxyalkanoate synthesis regulator phasin